MDRNVWGGQHKSSSCRPLRYYLSGGVNYEVPRRGSYKNDPHVRFGSPAYEFGEHLDGDW